MPKLTPAQQQMLIRTSAAEAEQTQDHTPAPTREEMLDAALRHARDGWHVFPLNVGTKIPLKGSRGALDGTRDEDQIRQWWAKHPYNIGANLGDDRIAIDIDMQHGGVFLDAYPPTRKHLSGRDNGNAHLIYRYTPGSIAAMLKSDANVIGMGTDTRTGRGSYIVMPPSRHEITGKPYRNVGGLEHVLTDPEMEAIFEEAMVEFSPNQKRGLALVKGGLGAPSQLSNLLENPPAEGGRNDWLAKVAGHYAKQYRDKEDLYQTQMRVANALLARPLDDEEFHKTIRSVWGSESNQVREKPARKLSDRSGWLNGNGRTLFVQIAIKEGDQTIFETAGFGDFDIQAEGVAVDDEMKRTYWVRITWEGHVIRTILEASVLSDDKKLRAWLQQFGPTIVEPPNSYPKMPPGVRIARYLNSQEPARVSITDTLGYQQTQHGSGFVTLDGWITEDGWVSKEDSGVVANPRLVQRDLAPYQYGWYGSRKKAVEVLRQVLEFQEEQAVSIFGAWWAACLLKPQFHTVSSLFPLFGVEASSESGKTTGFFDLMVQLNGNHQGHVAPTRPVLRDYMSANRNGIVWVDDLDSLQAYEELLRATTSNGTIAKMDNENTGVKATQVVAPVLITGESLGLQTQKALADRTIQISVNSPKNRKARDGKRPQWDDIVALQTQFKDQPGGLASVAGWFVQDALRFQTEALKAFGRNKGRGRYGDVNGVLLTGAQLLDSILAGKWTEKGEHYKLVNAWVLETGVNRLSLDNSLTMKLLPWALQQFGMPKECTPQESFKFQGIDTPVVLVTSKDPMRQTPELWYHPGMLAAAWGKEKMGRVEARTESEAALQSQALALGGQRKSVRVTGTDRYKKMRLLPEEYTKAVLERVE